MSDVREKLRAISSLQKIGVRVIGQKPHGEQMGMRDLTPTEKVKAKREYDRNYYRKNRGTTRKFLLKCNEQIHKVIQEERAAKGKRRRSL